MLRLTINDTTTPLHEIKFLRVPCGKGGITYTTAMDLARHWRGVLEVLMARSDLGRARAIPSIEQISIADEIRKLADLRDEGLLTPGEFEAQKIRTIQTLAG